MEIFSKCMEIIGTMRELLRTVKKAMGTARHHILIYCRVLAVKLKNC